MKNLTFAFVVAIGLCACSAPRACAQSPADYMAAAVTDYHNAVVYAQYAFDNAPLYSADWENAGSAHDSLKAAVSAAKLSEYYYSIGDNANGYDYAGEAIANSKDALSYLRLITGTDAVGTAASIARQDAKAGNAQATDAQND